MKLVRTVEEAINASTLPPGSRVYVSGNAATPQVMLNHLAQDKAIGGIELLSVLLLGDMEAIFSREVCERVTHRVIFNGHASREAVNRGWAKYQLMHLSDIPRQLHHHLQPNVAMISVSGPDPGGNYSLGTTVEGVAAAITCAKAQGGLVIAERNAQMPFVLGTTIPSETIDLLLDVDYALPASPVKPPDEASRRIARMIAERYIDDGATLQFGIGQVPEAVTDALIDKGVRDLGIHTELFADAMRRLVQAGCVTNRQTFTATNFSMSAIFLASNQAGYQWLHFNSSVQSRPCDYTNNILNIARQPKMVSINSAIGIDLHGNIWADSLQARKIYSGVGGQSDFIRGAYLSEGGIPIIAMTASTAKGVSKIVDKCPEGITTTAIAADPVIMVTEHGVFDPRGMGFSERAVGIAHLAAPSERDRLLKQIYESAEWHHSSDALKDKRPKGFLAFDR